MEKKRSLGRYISGELRAHITYTIFFTALGMVVAAALTYEGRAHSAEEQANLIESAHGLFQALHPMHLLLSAMATTAMLRRHERRAVKAVLVGLAGSLGLCGASDVLLPYLSGLLIAPGRMEFHWCLTEHPGMVLPFVAMGVAGGLLAAAKISTATIFSHSAHVLVSSLASLFYLVGYGVTGWMDSGVLPWVFVVVFLCVTIPCCASDIVFPLFFVRKGDGTGEGHHGH